MSGTIKITKDQYEALGNLFDSNPNKYLQFGISSGLRRGDAYQAHDGRTLYKTYTDYSLTVHCDADFKKVITENPNHRFSEVHAIVPLFEETEETQPENNPTAAAEVEETDDVKFDREKHTRHLTPGQFAHFEQLEAEAEEASSCFGSAPGWKRMGYYSTEQIFTDPEVWLNWKLFQIVEQVENDEEESEE